MRYLQNITASFAEEKFVLLTGPRQVGKTSLAKQWLNETSAPIYLNWDISDDRSKILSKNFAKQLGQNRLVLDELHKYPRWKSWIKGLFDRKINGLQVIVTGSARMDVFQKGGDSLLGRHELLHLHPFSIGELTHGTVKPPPESWLNLELTHNPDRRNWTRLFVRGGFPEPFTKDNDLQHQRWSTRRRELLIGEDLREISQIKTLALVEQLYLLLPDRVGSLLSLNGLREDLQVAFDTVKVWVEILDRLYITYRIAPYSKNIARALKKEQKIYFWDWSQISDEGARFENVVASHLLKSIHAWNDIGYGDFKLHYLRDLEKREIDFLISNKQKPIVLIEVKKSDRKINEHTSSLVSVVRKKYPEIPFIQLVDSEGVNDYFGLNRIVDACTYLTQFS